MALTGDAMEEWHRYALPAFVERTKQRMKAHCEDKEHQPWPAQGRHTRNQAPDAVAARARLFAGDVAYHTKFSVADDAPSSPRLQLVDGANVDLEGRS